MIVKYISITNLSSFQHGKSYDVESSEDDWYRIFDETGEDYLYPADWFEIVEGNIDDIPHSYPPELMILYQKKCNLPDEDVYEKYKADRGEKPTEYKQRIIDKYGLMEELFIDKVNENMIDS